MTPAGFDAVVLAGGAAQRLGGADKALVPLAGRPLLRHVLDAVTAANLRIVAGPPRDVGVEVLWCAEDPPNGGPVAGLAAALPLTTAPTVLVLAVDLPAIGGAVDALVTACAGRRVAVLCDGQGRLNHVAAAWPREALLARVADRPARSRSMRSLYEDVEIEPIVDMTGAGADCDTWDDVAGARRRWEIL